MHAFTIATVAAMALTASAQSGSDSPTKGLEVQANTISSSKRNGYCSAQKNSCNYLCPGGWDTNTCDATTLSYNCSCTPPAKTPDLLQYMNTIPYFECQEYIAACMAGNTSDATNQQLCQKDNHCATQDPSKFKASSSSASSTASASASGSPTGTSTGANAAETSKKSAGGKLGVAQGLLAVFVAGMVGIVA